VYPITLSFSDGSTEEVADKETAKAAVKAWKEANPEAEGRPSIAFPYEVMLKDSTTTTLTTQEELDALKASCPKEGGRGDRDRGGKNGRGGRG